MNKFLTKIAKICLGLSMAVGVGVAISASKKDVSPVHAGDVTDELTASSFAATSTTYTNFSNVSAASDAKYAGNSAKDSSGNIQLRSKNSNSGIVSTTSGGKVKSVTITVGSGSNTVDIYGSNTAYTEAANLYNSGKQGTKVGSVSATGTVTFTEEYAYVGIRSNSGAIYLSKVEITWDDGQGGGGQQTATITGFNVTAPSAYYRNDPIALSDWTIVPTLSEGTGTASSIANFLSVSPALSTSTTGTFPITITYNASAANAPYAMSENVSNTISSSYTVNPIPDTALSFKSSSKTIAINDEITLDNELATNTGDSTVIYTIKDGSDDCVSLNDGVVTGTALGEATITATKGNLTAELIIIVSNVQTWSHTFSNKLDSYSGDKTLTGKTWTFDPTWSGTAASVQDVNSTKGQQFGTGSNSLSELVLSSSSFIAYSAIQEITIETSGASSINATLTVVVGTSTYLNGENESVSLTSSNASYTFTGSASGDVILTWTQSSSKAIYIKSISITYDATEPTQAGLNLAWASGKGTYKNGNAAGSKINLASDFTLYKATSNGTSYGSAITSGYTTYIKNGSNKYLANGTWNDEQTAFSTGTDQIAFTGVAAGSYSLFVTTPKETEGVWTSNYLTLIIVDKVATTVTMNTEVTKLIYVAYYDAFAPYSGTVNVSYNDGGSGSNHTPVIKYFNGANEVMIGNLLNSDNTFNVASDTTLTVKLFDTGDTAGSNAFASYTLTIYASELAVADGNGSGAEYQSGATVALNPSVTFFYNNLTETDPIDSSLVDLYIKKKGETGDGTLYGGTLPEVEEAETYTITAKLKINPSMSDHYDIDIYNAVFDVDHSSAKKNYIFGESFSKENLVVTLTYGSASPTTIDAANYSVVDENNNVIDVIKFIGSKEVTVKYLGYSESYTITSTNVGSSTSNIHDDIPGDWAPTANASSHNYTSSTSNGISSSDGFASGSKTGGSSSKINGSLLITKYNAFSDKYVSEMTLSFKGKSSSNAGSTFTITLTAISGNTEVSTKIASDSHASTTSNQTWSMAITGLTYSDAIDGWKITCVKDTLSTGNGNLEFSELKITYKYYEQGESISYNSTPGEQAIAFAVYFNSEIGGLCSEGGDTSETNVNAIKAKWATLNTEYTNMVADSKDYFASNLSQSDIARTIGMYKQIIKKYGQTNFIKDSNNAVVVSASGPYLPLFGLNSNNSNTIAIIVIISMVSVTAIGGYFFLRKRKEQ